MSDQGQGMSGPSGPLGFGQPPAGFGASPPPGGGGEPSEPGAFWSPTDAVGKGFELIRSDLGGVFLPLLASTIIVSIPAGVSNGVVQGLMASDDGSGQMIAIANLVSLVFQGISLVVSAFIGAGVVRFCLKKLRGEEAGFGVIFSGGDVFIANFVASLLASVAITIGFFLCFVPGIILALGLCMATPLIVDRGLGPIEALQESWNLTTGHKANLFVYGVLGFLVMLVGLAACCVGIYVAGPILTIGFVWIYTRINGR